MKRNRTVFQCDGCGVDIELTPSKARNSVKHFCSRQCYGKWQSSNIRGETNPSWKPPVSVECAKCGTTFEVLPSDAKRRRYCSTECAGVSKFPDVKVQCHWCSKSLERPHWWANRQERHFCDMKCKGHWQSTQTGENANAYKGTMVQVLCSHCGKIVERDPSKVGRNDNFFCSPECLNEWRAIHMRRENNPNWVEPIITQCAFCGSLLERNPSRVGVTERKVHFCSKDCRYGWMSNALSGENSPHWKGGTIRYYGPNWNRQRQRARKRDNHTCQHCGITRQELGRELHVHHIQSFRSFDYLPGENENYRQANRLANLISLCPSCHKRAEHGQIPIQPRLV